MYLSEVQIFFLILFVVAVVSAINDSERTEVSSAITSIGIIALMWWCFKYLLAGGYIVYNGLMRGDEQMHFWVGSAIAALYIGHLVREFFKSDTFKHLKKKPTDVWKWIAGFSVIALLLKVVGWW